MVGFLWFAVLTTPCGSLCSPLLVVRYAHHPSLYYIVGTDSSKRACPERILSATKDERKRACPERILSATKDERRVAGAGIAPAFRGYGPREILLLHPAIKINIPQNMANK